MLVCRKPASLAFEVATPHRHPQRAARERASRASDGLVEAWMPEIETTIASASASCVDPRGKDRRWIKSHRQPWPAGSPDRVPTDFRPFSDRPAIGGGDCPIRSWPCLPTFDSHASSTPPLEWVSWSNHHRLLRPIGYIPPTEVEASYWRQQTRDRGEQGQPGQHTQRSGCRGSSTGDGTLNTWLYRGCVRRPLRGA